MSDIRDKLVKCYLLACDRCDNILCSNCEYKSNENCMAGMIADVILEEMDINTSNKTVLFVEEGSIDITALPNTKIVEYKKGSQPPCMIKIN